MESKDDSLRNLFQPDIVKVINEKIDALSPSLRKVSLELWNHPEVAFEEQHAHDVLTSFISEHGFTVTKSYLGLSTAWRAEYSRGRSGRVIGINSEMDALPGLGHACGHNLIAVSGIAVAIALRAVMEARDIPGKIILLGTPAEEHGGGKIKLLEKGAYDEMDVCVMCHPGPGAADTAYISSWLALQPLEVEFLGHSAHAAYSPWEAQNALDAAFLAYSSISVLRQQIKPTHRVHGIVSGQNWEPNVIPDYAKMRWIVRAPTWKEVDELRARVTACFEAAGLATSCKVKVTLGAGYYDVRQNNPLSECLSYLSSFNSYPKEYIPGDAFRSIIETLPSIQPNYSIPTEKNGGNHTPDFAKSARTEKAHEITMSVSKGLALTALRVLQDDEFYHEVCGYA
ncbi:hypothetical protein K474DRAFT_1592196 [Panus rudis PR-1116 ss-1]|nr:hypothetical protein K474DRAFT_1592196 [Panus rudis PR-1116 ss-1]